MLTIIKAFRPMRLIKQKRGLNLVANALIESGSGILNVFLLLTTIWITYGVIGIILYRDRFGYCQTPVNFRVGIGEVNL